METAPAELTKKVVQYKRRRLYEFVCVECKKPHRKTLKYDTLKEGLCGKCKKNRPDPNQLSILTVGATATVKPQ